MNAHPHFRTQIDGQTLHFMHVRSPHEHATPLLLTHTYPGSFADFLDVIGPLTDPTAHGGRAEDAFHLVIPSLPGMGFSTPLSSTDWTMERTARAFDRLMRSLGYDSYGAHGSDGGRDALPRARDAEPRGLPRRARAAAVLLPFGRPGRVRVDEPGRLRGARVRRLVPDRQRLRRHERQAPAHDRRGAERLAGRRARLPRAVRELRQRHQPDDPRPGAPPGQPAVADQHRRPAPSCFTTSRRTSRRASTTARSASPCSPTTSRRSGRSPSATTPTSSRGRSTPAAATSPPWRCPRSSSARCASSTPRERPDLISTGPRSI